MNIDSDILWGKKLSYMTKTLHRCFQMAQKKLYHIKEVRWYQDFKGEMQYNNNVINVAKWSRAENS